MMGSWDGMIYLTLFPARFWGEIFLWLGPRGFGWANGSFFRSFFLVAGSFEGIAVEIFCCF